MESNANNIQSEFIYIFLFYLITAIVGIGVILNLIYLSKWGQSFKIKYLKKVKFMSFISNTLIFLSIIWFPVSSIYIFTQLYYSKSITLF